MLEINWKDPSSYDYLDKYQDYRFNKLWGWEFLRRNSAYQKHWAETLTLFYRGEDILSKYREAERRSSKYLSKAINRHIDFIEALPEIYKQTDPEHNQFLLMTDNVKKRWGIAVLFNPKNTCPPEVRP